MSHKKHVLLVSLFVFYSILYASGIKAQEKNNLLVDSVDVYSKSMDISLKSLVVLPCEYHMDQMDRYPVLCLLHGYDGDHGTLINKTKTNLQELASENKIIIVCPDGKNSWYWDSPIDSDSQFETYISQELVHFMDSAYRTIPSSANRAISGVSMGGEGALWIAMRHPDIFGACGSISGGVDPRRYPRAWNLKSLLGDFNTHRENWYSHAIINQLDRIMDDSLAIVIDCGTDDMFFTVNEKLHTEMVKKKIQHDYIIRIGGHNHEYWSNALDYQILFFHKFFYKDKYFKYKAK